MRQDGARELINHEAAIGAQHRVRRLNDFFADRFGQDTERNAGYDVVDMRAAHLPHDIFDAFDGLMGDVQALVRNGSAEVLHKIVIQFDDAESCVGAHALENFLGEISHAGTEFDDCPGTLPIHAIQNAIHQKTGTGNDRTDGYGMLNEILQENPFMRAHIGEIL